MVRLIVAAAIAVTLVGGHLGAGGHPGVPVGHRLSICCLLPVGTCPPNLFQHQ
jgi:hypothetical protein